MKKEIIVMLLAILISISNDLIAKTSGTIYFTDGHTLKFTDVGFTGLGKNRCLQVKYEGTERKIPVEKLKWYEIVDFSKIEIGPYKGNNVYTPLIKYETTTGIIASYEWPYSITYIEVYINDELTGEHIKQQITFAIKENGVNKLNIKKIVLDN